MALILLIDDSEMVQKMVSLILEDQGHRVTVARDMPHGVREIRESNFDLILMDLNLPGVRGEAGIKLIRQRLQLTTPIIVLSGEITANTVLSMKPLGVSGFVAKGEDFEWKLSLEIDKVMEERDRSIMDGE